MKVLLLFVFAVVSAVSCYSRDTSIYNGKLTSNMDANGMSITNSPLPSLPGDLANKDYVDGIAITKQTNLVSGVNIKTINNQSLLGAGNIEIQGGGGGSDPNAVTNVFTNGVSIVANKVADIYNPVRAIVSSASVTNAGAVADAAAKYLPLTGGRIEYLKLPYPSSGGWNSIYLETNYMGVTMQQTLPLYLSSLEYIVGDKTLSDYKITDAYTKTDCDDKFLEDEADPVWNDEKANYLTTQTASTTYQPLISDLTTIRTGAGLGATAVQPAAITDMATKTWVSGQIPTDTHIGQVATNAVATSDSLWSQTNTKLTNTIVGVSTPVAESVAETAIANANTTYTPTTQIVALNQSVQYVVGNGTEITIAAPTAVANGSRDWIVYVNATADTPLNLSQLGGILVADEAYTNACVNNKVTALYFTEMTNNVFVIGRQELTTVK